ncbi:hypothetical protein M9H77_36052 [Catharanthus roseus]|uniref:Uncharacterized protein n=1 Tax=Catharanthus roseus TaxID=4058 RepID=A0ACB9ZQR1_CATRO|nr:hypothetical protein M9H77_36052 [Catharanthus roseus]
MMLVFFFLMVWDLYGNETDVGIMPDYHNWAYHGEAVWGMNVRTNVELSSALVQTTTVFNCDCFDSSDRRLKMHPQYEIVELHFKKRYPAYDPFVFAHQAEKVSYITYLGTKRQKIDWWPVLKSGPQVFDVPVVEVEFQENVGITETSLMDRRIEDIGPLTYESGLSTWLILLDDVMTMLKRMIILSTTRWNGCPKTKTLKKKQNMNRTIIPTLSMTSWGRKTQRLDLIGTSTSITLESDIRVGDVEVSTVASDTSTTSVDAHAGSEQSVVLD